MIQDEVRELARRLHEAQRRATEGVLDTVDYESLDFHCPDGFTVNDVLKMWSWHFWSHHRDLIMARGRLVNDNPHFHVPHHVREANEQFGRFVGELMCLTDEQLDQCVPGGRSAREVVIHVLDTLEGYFVSQVEQAQPEEDRAG